MARNNSPVQTDARMAVTTLILDKTRTDRILVLNCNNSTVPPGVRHMQVLFSNAFNQGTHLVLGPCPAVQLRVVVGVGEFAEVVAENLRKMTGSCILNSNIHSPRS